MRIEAYNQMNKIYSADKVNNIKQNTVTGKNDKFEISQTACDYQVAKKAVADTQEVRQDLINRIKTQMQAGQYQVSAEDFANKVVESYNKQIY